MRALKDILKKEEILKNTGSQYMEQGIEFNSKLPH